MTIYVSELSKGFVVNVDQNLSPPINNTSMKLFDLEGKVVVFENQSHIIESMMNNDAERWLFENSSRNYHFPQIYVYSEFFSKKTSTSLVGFLTLFTQRCLLDNLVSDLVIEERVFEECKKQNPLLNYKEAKKVYTKIQGESHDFTTLSRAIEILDIYSVMLHETNIWFPFLEEINPEVIVSRSHFPFFNDYFSGEVNPEPSIHDAIRRYSLEQKTSIDYDVFDTALNLLEDLK